MVLLRSPDVTWHAGALTRKDRWRTLGQRGATVWFTGLPGSGKSTIAAVVEELLIEEGRAAYRLDGDNLRHGLCRNLGFSAEDRAENMRRVAHVACLLADAGAVAVVALVSPYAAGRAQARQIHAEEDLPFIEVFVDTPLEECERRDPKGLYARARAGDLPGFTGVDDPYEPPLAPELRVTSAQSVHLAAQSVLALVPPVES
ncbi:MAG TPA: adenylyl-sulfate kinase [Solirubrobacteraceae bacterium]|nr:adenylyl-sulfate kinase [Solirubrobacteraceae bacterium]